MRQLQSHMREVPPACTPKLDGGLMFPFGTFRRGTLLNGMTFLSLKGNGIEAVAA